METHAERQERENRHLKKQMKKQNKKKGKRFNDENEDKNWKNKLLTEIDDDFNEDI